MKTKIRNIIDLILAIVIIGLIVIGLVCNGTYQTGKETEIKQNQEQANKDRLNELKDLYKIAEDAQDECVKSCNDSWSKKKNEYHTEAELIRGRQNESVVKKAEEVGLIKSS